MAEVGTEKRGKWWIIRVRQLRVGDRVRTYYMGVEDFGTVTQVEQRSLTIRFDEAVPAPSVLYPHPQVAPTLKGDVVWDRTQHTCVWLEPEEWLDSFGRRSP
jgi:hypothetical protein